MEPGFYVRVEGARGYRIDIREFNNFPIKTRIWLSIGVYSVKVQNWQK